MNQVAEVPCEILDEESLFQQSQNLQRLLFRTLLQNLLVFPFGAVKK